MKWLKSDFLHWIHAVHCYVTVLFRQAMSSFCRNIFSGKDGSPLLEKLGSTHIIIQTLHKVVNEGSGVIADT